MSNAQVFVAPTELIGHPDLVAFLQAFYSRSHKSIVERLEDFSPDSMDADKIRKSLQKWFIQYNHESIGDCGDIVLFVENVSFMTAKAIQDNPLYSGQETSSRYIDFSNQPEPDNLPENSLHHYWMGKYKDSIHLVRDMIRSEFPELSEDAVKPKAFDISRGLLPVTALTQLSWKGSIREIRRQLGRLLCHPLNIVRDDAETILQVVRRRFPDLFGKVDRDETYPWFLNNDDYSAFSHMMYTQSNHYNNEHTQPLLNRHPRALGPIAFLDSIDFGGYRDVQRHRRAYVKSQNPLDILESCMPTILANKNGFYQTWLAKAGIDFEDYSVAADAASDWVVPLLTPVDTVFVADIEQWKYTTEMRTKPTVHPTVRDFFREGYSHVESYYGDVLEQYPIVCNEEESDYERRGRQTIRQIDA